MNQPIRSHTFPNGLVLVAEPMPWLQSAAFTALVPSGSAVDPNSRAGLSGMTCEMALRGSADRDSRQFVLDLDNLGVERGESVSASHTGFRGATLAENLHDTLAIYADMLTRPLLPDEQIEAGRQVCLQELRAVEDEPGQKAMVELRRLHYPDPWGQPSHGELEALEATTIDDIRAHFQANYRPNGAILGVAGRFDWDELRDHVGEILGDWQPADTPAIVETPPEGRYKHLPYDSNQTHVAIAYPNVPYRDPSYFTAWGAVGVLGGGSSARLFTEVRERRGLCYSVHAACHTLRDLGAVLCYAGTSADRAQETLDVILAELNRLAEGIEESELNRLKARIKSALIMQQESSYSRASSIARDWYHLGRVRTLEEVGRLVDDLSATSINAYLSEHPPGDFKVVTLGPSPLEVSFGIS